ncbi:MAG: 4Fe-4S binding protein [Planctomycetaceae bacterium]|nr:4Fe-4S binding protein [Planctomycetaceae bacterium]
MLLNTTTRRQTLKTVCRSATAAGLLGFAGWLAVKNKAAADAPVWQIDPNKCIGCGQCAYRCVSNVSAVKAFHNFKMCGYCDLCTGFFEPQPLARNTGAENQLCPVGAIARRDVENPYFEYIIDENLCVGCGKCVDGCFSLGNGSLFLQIHQQLCKHCNQCAIALYCPAKAIVQIPAKQSYLFKEA